MKVELEKTFPLPGSAEVAWEFLQNIEAVAGCMPGAKITERLPDGGYKGTVTVRVGPATMSFRGEVEVRDIDAAAHSLRLLGKGTDSTGTSGASMDLAARIEAVAEGLEQSRRQERSDDERQGRGVRRTDDEFGRRPDPEAVRRQLRGAGGRTGGTADREAAAAVPANAAASSAIAPAVGAPHRLPARHAS